MADMQKTPVPSGQTGMPGQSEAIVPQPEETEGPISSELAANKQWLERVFLNCQDVSITPYQYGASLSHTALVVYCVTLTQMLKVNFLKSALQDLIDYTGGPGADILPGEIVGYFNQHGVSAKSAQMIERTDQVIEQILAGDVLIFIDGWTKALSYNALSIEERQVTESITEPVVKGPHDGTIENLAKNIGIIRGRLKSTDLKIEYVKTKGQGISEFAFGYMEGVVDGEMLAEFRKRIDPLAGMDVPGISLIEEQLESDTYSPYPQIRWTERPDTAVAALKEGKVIALVNGFPAILICPGLFFEFFQSPEDYYERTLFSTMIRHLRFIAFVISCLLPSTYIALTTFHPELIPTVLLLSILKTREGIPFPSVVEAVIMEFFFELLREAGVRLPRPTGSAVSIVGALVIGEAAINAGIASPIMVVIVALTGIASFSIPQYSLGIATRIIRFPMMIIAATMGGFGIMIGSLLILVHLMSLRVLGQPYLPAVGATYAQLWRDIFLRSPLRKLKNQPNKQ